MYFPGCTLLCGPLRRSGLLVNALCSVAPDGGLLFAHQSNIGYGGRRGAGRGRTASRSFARTVSALALHVEMIFVGCGCRECSHRSATRLILGWVLQLRLLEGERRSGEAVGGRWGGGGGGG